MNRLMLSAVGISLTLSGTFAVAQTVDLQQLYLDSLENNPMLASAALEVDSARKGSRIIDGQYRPQVNVGVQYGMLRNDWTTMNETDGQGGEVSLTVGQNIFNDQLNRASALSEQQHVLSKASYDYALVTMQMSVVNGYFNALKAQEKQKQVNATKQAIGEHLIQVKHRYRNGLVPENDVKETRAQYDLAETAVIFAHNELEKALDYLYELTGREYAYVASLDSNHPKVSIPQANGYVSWQELAQAESQKMVIQRQLVELSREQISLAQAGHMPTIGLVAEYRYAFATQSRSNDPQQTKGSFQDLDNNATVFAGVAMSLPAYRGGSTDNQVEQANIQYQQALELQRHTWRQVARKVRSAEKDLVALESAQSAYQQAVLSAESALKATEQGLDIGTRTIVDVLDSTRQLYSAREQLTVAQIDFLVANLQLHFLAGVLDDEALKATNRLLAI
ncbi:TolC family outer membrane protein [Vibrio tapetis subsp. quintayensis]|uniref:TolC family outer membrane protein n=1 Tax=Vibrio tapetis TaxID=52443 RepID=UPI0025B591EE|nr:TolC family outer membrane protein [Vibrio tapetis]MDN3680948.1 TolC family outer membrane protein [Vibrio tapetis subsp. quintayensis]